MNKTELFLNLKLIKEKIDVFLNTVLSENEEIFAIEDIYSCFYKFNNFSHFRKSPAFEDNIDISKDLIKRSSSVKFLKFLKDLNLSATDIKNIKEILPPYNDSSLLNNWSMPTYNKGRNFANFINIMNNFESLNEIEKKANKSNKSNSFSEQIQNKIIILTFKNIYANALMISLGKKIDNIDLKESKPYEKNNPIKKVIDIYGLDFTLSFLQEINKNYDNDHKINSEKENLLNNMLFNFSKSRMEKSFGITNLEINKKLDDSFELKYKMNGKIESVKFIIDTNDENIKIKINGKLKNTFEEFLNKKISGLNFNEEIIKNSQQIKEFIINKTFIAEKDVIPELINKINKNLVLR